MAAVSTQCLHNEFTTGKGMCSIIHEVLPRRGRCKVRSCKAEEANRSEMLCFGFSLLLAGLLMVFTAEKYSWMWRTHG